MATLLDNGFQQYSFDTKEEIQAQVFTESNLQWIKNKRALAMIERSRISFDPTLPNATIVFTQQEAALMGEIRAYDTIIDAHESVVASLSSLTNPQNQE